MLIDCLEPLLWAGFTCLIGEELHRSDDKHTVGNVLVPYLPTLR